MPHQISSSISGKKTLLLLWQSAAQLCHSSAVVCVSLCVCLCVCVGAAAAAAAVCVLLSADAAVSLFYIVFAVFAF